MSLELALAALRQANRVDGTRASYRKDNPAEYQKVMDYLDGSPRPAGADGFSLMGQGLVWVEDERRKASPPPPPPTDAYFVEDWSTGRFESSRWSRLHSYTSPGYFNTPIVSSPDGRVAVVADPAGSGKKCARVEIRDSDPGYAVNPDIDKSEIVGNATFNIGETRWFEWDLYFPYTSTEKFEWPRGGSQPYFALLGFHPPSSTGWSAFHLGWEAWQINPAPDRDIFVNFFLQGGTFPEDTYNEVINLLRLTNSDGSRVMANHNRWIQLKWGMKFASDSSGWIEAWVDGTNVYPRKSRPTMWAGHSGSYYKYGLYTRHDSYFPSGRSVCYFGRTTIGNNRPF